MVEVTPVLRQLFNSLASRETSEADGARPPVARVADKLERRLRQIKIERGQPKSVRTSLRDLCEM